MRQPCNNKKGLSTIISTLLMIIIVMVGMTLVFSYVTFYAQNYQTGTGSSILESLTIEDIWILSPSIVNITVYNTGTTVNLGTDSGVAITLDQIYVNGTPLSNTFASLAGTINFNNIRINPNSHVTIEAQWPSGTFTKGNTYTFKIITERGSNFEAGYNDP